MSRNKFDSYDMVFSEEDMDSETLELLRENDEITKPTLRLAAEERREMLLRIAAKNPMKNVALSLDRDTAQNSFNSESMEDEEMEELVTSAPIKDNIIDLKTIRKKLGLNQIAFSRKLSISQALVSQVESGKIPASDNLVKELRKLKLVA